MDPTRLLFGPGIRVAVSVGDQTLDADLSAGIVVGGELVAIDESSRCNLISRRPNVATNGR
jgi:hypothetical protein